MIPAFALAALLGLATSGSQDDVVAPAAEVSATADSSDAGLTGLVALKLEFVPYEDFDRAWRVRIELWDGPRRMVEADHSPDPPTKLWRSGKPVRYAIDVPLPFSGAVARGGEPDEPGEIEVRIGFVNAATGETHGPGESLPMPGPLPTIATFSAPSIAPVESAERVAALVAAARERKSSRPADAWSILELGIRAASDDAIKRTLRDELLALGHFAPRAITPQEQRIVDQRIRDERERYLRLISGRMYDRKRFHGAMLLLAEVGGSLAEKADAAVLGALADAERAEKDADGVKLAMFEYLPDDEAAEVDEAIASLGPTKALLERAELWQKKKRYAAARRATRALLTGESTLEMMDAARERLPALEAEWLAAVPPEEKAEADAALAHPAFARTTVVPSHRFLFIGPKTLVETMPPDSVRRFDLAYVFLTDLFGRLPNPDGDRVTVYFKELWDFGGGVGGGKTIDIGNADWKAKGTRVDNGLLYHELTHCIDDTAPVYGGFHEGLANFGAAYAFESLAQQGDSQHSFRGNLEAFEKEYLERDIEYWRIQNYGPSAGFFLSFVERHAKTKDGHDWRPYRQFFREYRGAPIRDGREPYVARALAHYLVRAFGNAAFDDLVRYRFPLIEADRAVIGGEIDAFDRSSEAADADDPLSPFRGDGAFARSAGSPLPRDVRTAELLKIAAHPEDFERARRFGESQLGIVYAWRVIGPFPVDGADPLACPFPPESVVDFSAQYPTKYNLVMWAKPSDRIPLTRDGSGWVRIEYPYQDDTAIYAFSEISVERDVAAFAHVRADDDLALFVNGEQAGSYLDRGWNSSTQLSWRGPKRDVPDAIRLPVSLRAGKNPLLLKIKNRQGVAGFALALSDEHGAPLAGLTASAEDASGAVAPEAGEREWKRVFHHSFRSKAFGGKLDVTVGAFKSREGALQGETTSRGVEWRKYTVRPGFPKDSPSNLAWLEAGLTKDLVDFRLELELDASAPPKLLVTFQGEGGKDGLSGWNLILEPSGDKARASLERYDRLVYQSAPLAPSGKNADGKNPGMLVLSLRGDRLTVALGETVLLDRVPIQPIRVPGSDKARRERIGFATWGVEPRIKSIELLR